MDNVNSFKLNNGSIEFELDNQSLIFEVTNKSIKFHLGIAVVNNVPPVDDSPSLDFSKSFNSQYIPIIF